MIKHRHPPRKKFLVLMAALQKAGGTTDGERGTGSPPLASRGAATLALAWANRQAAAYARLPLLFRNRFVSAQPVPPRTGGCLKGGLPLQPWVSLPFLSATPGWGSPPLASRGAATLALAWANQQATAYARLPFLFPNRFVSAQPVPLRTGGCLKGGLPLQPWVTLPSFFVCVESFYIQGIAMIVSRETHRDSFLFL